MKTTIIFLAAALAVAPAKAGQTETKAPAKPDEVLECGVACIVLAVGVIVLSQLYPLCKKLNSTNAPAPPTGTNTAGNVAFVRSLALTSTNISPQTALALTGGAAWSIGACGYTDARGGLFTTYCTGTLQTSCDLVTWTNCIQFQAWISAQEILTVTPTGTNSSFNFIGGNGTNTITGPALTGPRRFFRLAP